LWRKFFTRLSFVPAAMPFVAFTLPFVRLAPLMEEKRALIEHLQTSAMHAPRVQIAKIEH